MPAKGKPPLSNRQRHTIARGKAVGKQNRIIAKEAGVGRSVVDHATADPRIGPLIHQLKVAHRNELEEIYTGALRSLKLDVVSKRADVRLPSRAQALKFIGAGDGPPAETALAGPSWTWEEFTIMRAKLSKSTE